MKTIKLPCYGILVNVREGGGGGISSELWEDITDEMGDEDAEEAYIHNRKMDAIESFILACACAGIDIESPAFIEAIETTVQACANNS
tara:strand:+ start:91 stop:354 length:264 start_codon:yes stop_codon:yes gene_type:complete